MTLADRWVRAEPFASWCERTETCHGLWTSLWARASAPGASVARARALARPWRLLALTADWCGDAVNSLPTIARLAAVVPERLELRCLDRDRNLDLMDDHLTRGARSIPKVLAIGPAWRVEASWGPRPAELEAWVFGPGRALPREERYAHLRRWYARDRGARILAELLSALETAPSPA